LSEARSRQIGVEWREREAMAAQGDYEKRSAWRLLANVVNTESPSRLDREGKIEWTANWAVLLCRYLDYLYSQRATSFMKAIDMTKSYISLGAFVLASSVGVANAVQNTESNLGCVISQINVDVGETGYIAHVDNKSSRAILPGAVYKISVGRTLPNQSVTPRQATITFPDELLPGATANMGLFTVKPPTNSPTNSPIHCTAVARWSTKPPSE
jgi:hypothetical protein